MQKEAIKKRPHCPKCQAISTVKNGHNHNKQRYKCKICNFSFTRMESRGVPSSLKSLAYWLYLSKQSYGQIAQLFNVSAVAVYKWVKAYAQKIEFKEVGDNVKEIQIDGIFPAAVCKYRIVV
jgi:transposase